MLRFGHFNAVLDSSERRRLGEHMRKHRHTQADAIRGLPWGLVLGLTLGSFCAVCRAEGKAAFPEFRIDDEIFDNEKAVELVKKARSLDPMFCSIPQRSPHQAAEIYAQAISAQSNAAINAQLANRIAQIYAFYEDRQSKIVPDPATAAKWWWNCVAMSNPRQLLWMQAQMGLGSVAAIQHTPLEAIERYKAILAVDETQLELPPWKMRAPVNAQTELKQLRESAAEMKLVALENMLNAGRTISLDLAATLMKQVERDRPGSALAAKAEELRRSLRPQTARLLPKDSAPLSPIALAAAPPPTRNEMRWFFYALAGAGIFSGMAILWRRSRRTV